MKHLRLLRNTTRRGPNPFGIFCWRGNRIIPSRVSPRVPAFLKSLMQFLPFFSFLCIFSIACEPTYFESTQTLDAPNFSENVNTPLLLTNVAFHTTTMRFKPNEKIAPNLHVYFSNGAHYRYVKNKLATAYHEEPLDVVWFVNDEMIASFSGDGELTGLREGQTTLKVTVEKLSTTLNLIVSEDDADPEILLEDLPWDPFLNEGDTITLNLGDEGGYKSGPEYFPEILYGPPDASPVRDPEDQERMDVVSLGNAGEVIIELSSRAIVDGLGIDFIVFENAQDIWKERGLVSVSQNGIDYESFACDAFDPSSVFPGCAGVAPVNYSFDPNDYLNPDTAGGDGFDLADLGFPEARFLKITDLETCQNLYFCQFGQAGFDLDAVAIINGETF